jgi:hypothetical protein
VLSHTQAGLVFSISSLIAFFNFGYNTLLIAFSSIRLCYLKDLFVFSLVPKMFSNYSMMDGRMIYGKNRDCGRNEELWEKTELSVLIVGETRYCG